MAIFIRGENDDQTIASEFKDDTEDQNRRVKNWRRKLMLVQVAMYAYTLGMGDIGILILRLL